MNIEILTLLLFGSLIIFIALGLPIAFSMGGIAVVFFIFTWHPALYAGLYWDFKSTVSGWSFLPIPLFIFMANMLERSGIAEALYTMIHRWAGGLAGGLAMGTVFICAVLAAMVGLSSTATVTMGLTALPAMLKRGYDKDMAIGSIAAGGTLGVLIPPSVLMVVYAMVANTSPARLFLAGYLPGVLLSLVFIIYIGVRTRFQPELGPPLPVEDRANWKDKFVALRSVILPLILIFLVLGSIFGGVATVTESAAAGAAGSILCAAINRGLTWQKLKEANYETLKLTCMIMFIVAASVSFSRAYIISGASQLVGDVFLTLPLGKWAAIFVIQVIFFILGCFIDPFGIIMITAPIFVPTIIAFNLDPVWFGVIFVVNMEMAYLTPPVGLNLFLMKAVAPEGTTMVDIYRAVIPFVLLLGFTLALLIIFPQIALWLPNLVLGPPY